jgi:hypothetical protein
VDRYDNESEAAEVSFTAMDIQVSADVASGQYDSAQQVTLTAGEGAEIYYTLDGSQPFEKIKKFLSPLKNMKDRLQSRKYNSAGSSKKRWGRVWNRFLVLPDRSAESGQLGNTESSKRREN